MRIPWRQIPRSSITWGLLFGLVWALLTGGGATPRASVVFDDARGLVTITGADGTPATISNAAFNQVYMTNLIEVILIFLVLSLVAGWVAWQLTRIRPRGQPQPRLGDGTTSYVISFLASGTLFIMLFDSLGWERWFIGRQPTSAVIITGLIAFVLPLFAGIGAFFVWFLRLESVRPPDWKTRIPPPRDWLTPLLRDLVARIRAAGKGGNKGN